MIIICDKRIPEEYISALREKYPEAILLPFSPAENSSEGKVYESILCHPDIYFFQIDSKTLVYAPCVPKEYLKKLSRFNIQLIKGKNNPNGKYPNTTLYNAVRVGNCLVHNLNFTDPVVLDIARQNKMNLVDVEQGYTRCSVVVAGEEHVLTADDNIASILRGIGINTLLLSSGGVVLPGEKYGFIGGASGVKQNKSLILVGDLDKHHDKKIIKEFFSKWNINFTVLKGLPLYDAGSLIVCD